MRHKPVSSSGGPSLSLWRSAMPRAWILVVLMTIGLLTVAAKAEDSKAMPTGVRFSVDGEQKHFASIAREHTFFSSSGSKIQLQPAEGSTEQFTIIFFYVNFRQLDYPVELPLPRGTFDPEQPMAAMITIGFGYVDQEGNNWGGPGRVRLDALQADGMLSGSFTNVSLPHTKKELPNILLEDGQFTVSLGAR